MLLYSFLSFMVFARGVKMKRTFIAIVVIFLFPSLGVSEPTHPNEIGLYLNNDGTGPTGTSITNIPVTVFLVLTNPTDTENGGVPAPGVFYFECTLNFSPNPTNNLFILSSNWGPAVNLGDFGNMALGYSEHKVIGGVGPVTPEWVQLIEFQFMAITPTPIEVKLGPALDPGIPGQMVFQARIDGPMITMYPISGSHGAPVFIFNGEAVATEAESFGWVKALYR